MNERGPAQQRSMRPVIQTILVDVAPPLVAYYGLRAAGVSEYIALLSATVLSGLRLLYGVVEARRLDPFAAYLLLTFGLSLAVGLVTSDPKLVLVGNTFVNGLGGLIFLGSCVVGTPLTQVVGDRFHAEDNADAGQRRRIHVRLSAMWGIGLLLEVAIRLVVIAKLSVDTANGVNSVITLVVIGVLVMATVVIARRVPPQAGPARTATRPRLGADVREERTADPGAHRAGQSH